MTFALDSLPTPSEISGAINYLLGNMTPGLSYNQVTGEVTQNGEIVSYLYKYISVKYADSADGGTNFSDSPTGRLYYGTNNSNIANESTNPADYLWRLVDGGGFGSTKYLWYQTTGGRQIQFEVNVQRPDVGWVAVNTGAIDLDVISNSEITGQNFTPYFQPSSLQVTTVSGTPIFTNVIPQMFAVSGTNVAIFVDSQTDSDPQFENNTWRIGGSSTTGNGDIVYSNITIGSPVNAGGFAAWPAPTAMSSSTASIAVPTRYKDRFGNVYQSAVVTQTLVYVTQPVTGSKTQTAYLYQWNTGLPTNPGGVSTYTWATNTLSGYTGGAGWTTTLPSNPGTPFLKLYVAAKPVTDVVGATTTTVSWTSGFSIYDSTTASTPGFQTAQPTVYQWALSIPSISGTATYTWATGGFTAPTGWSTSITGSPSPGYTMYAATVTLVDASTASVSVINWTTASIVAAGYSGTAGSPGASSRIMYARIAGNPVPTSGLVTVSGDNRPTGAESAAVWNGSFNVTWYATDPSPSSSDSLYQADGIYDNSAGTTVWSTPYISSLKVGTLSAITVNTGALTVQDSITVSSSGNIKGGQYAYNSGSGFFLGYSGGYYKFSVGDSTSNLTWDGSSLFVQGTGKFWYPSSPYDYVSLGLDGNGSTVRVYRSAPSILPPLYIYDTANTSIASQWIYHPYGNCLDLTSDYGQNVSAWGGSGTTATEPVGWFAGSRQQAQLWAEGRKRSGSVSVHAGRFRVTDGSTIVSSAICGVDSLNGLGGYYCFYAETGTYGPFTGSHDCLLPKTETVETGDILVDVELIYKKDISNTLFSVTKSTMPNQHGIGIYVGIDYLIAEDPPACFMDTVNTIDEGPVYDPEGQYLYNKYSSTVVPEFYEIVEDYNLAVMNAVGEGQVNVCGENGDINRGDLIVTSSMVGKGMKQADDIIRSYTVAKARESVTFASPTEVKQIACIYLCG